MKRKLEISELIFKIISYVLLTVFALCCLYPFLYAVFASISGRHAVEYNEIVLLPKDVQFDAFSWMFKQDVFWNSYSNTLFLTIYGTVWSLVVSILGAYALSKKRLLFRKFFNFFLVFTMWFSAGIVPQRLNYLATKTAFHNFGIMDDKGGRQFREVALVVARKNGKSLFASAIALYEFFIDGGFGARIYCLAPKLDQAEIIHPMLFDKEPVDELAVAEDSGIVDGYTFTRECEEDEDEDGLYVVTSTVRSMAGGWGSSLTVVRYIYCAETRKK